MSLLYKHVPNSKLNENTVYEIKLQHKRLYQGFLAYMGKKYKVTPGTIDSIIKEQTWLHVKL